ERFGNPEFDFRFQADQVPETPSGDVGHPMDLRTSDGAQHGSDVDRGRLEEFLSPRTPGVADLVEQREGRLAQDSAGEGQAVRMDPVARQAHDDVSGSDRPSVHDLRLPDHAEAGAREVEFPYELGDDGNLPADDRDVRHLRTAVQPDADLADHLAVVR